MVEFVAANASGPTLGTGAPVDDVGASRLRPETRIRLRILLDRAIVPVARRVGWYPFRTIRGGVGRGLHMSLRNASADYTTGTNELPVQQAVAGHLARGGVFYDVGSNVGFFALIAARLAGPGGRVYAFEPVPANTRQIRANAQRNRLATIEVCPIAVGDRTCSIKLKLSSHPGGATVAAVGAAADASGTLQVQMATIDDLVEGGRLRPPDVVKIDVEGAELLVIAGMARTLVACRPTLICELDGATPEVVQADLRNLDAALDEHGYSLTILDPSYRGSGWEVLHAVARPTAGPGPSRG